jgi:anti-sigma regulatory factor (Ser/Thr protein kinase)
MSRDALFALVESTRASISLEPELIIFDFAKLEELQVGGVTVLCNLTALCRQRGIEVQYLNYEECVAVQFVTGSGLLDFGLEKTQLRSPSAQFLPIRLIEYDRSHGYTNNELIPWLANKLGYDPRALATLGACFAEVFNNIRDHSSFNVGCSAAHYNGTTGEATICFSDFGVGIPARIRTAKPNIVISDHNAIVLACKEGFTTKTTPRNRGAGLYVLSNYVVELCKGVLLITAGEGQYTCVPGKRNAKRGLAKYPGTMIRITLRKSDFKPDDVDEEDFKWD